jgi:hypothetical protein
MKRIVLIAVSIVSLLTTSSASADVLFESGTLGPTGVTWDDVYDQAVDGANLTSSVFQGVRFELNRPAMVTDIGGHFVAPVSSTFFGAIVRLDDSNDFPDSGDLSTPDVVGTTFLTFPNPSDEVFGNLEIRLEPGWYALVFGSGLFSATGVGGMPLNNPDVGTPTYIAFHSGAASEWANHLNPIFRNYRFVVEGQVVPEPAACLLTLVSLLSLLVFRRTAQ